MDKLPSDKELEEFYKDKFESHPFPFQEEAWEDMERLLDQQRRRRYGLGLLLFLLFSVGGFYLFSNLSGKTHDDQMSYARSTITSDQVENVQASDVDQSVQSDDQIVEVQDVKLADAQSDDTAIQDSRSEVSANVDDALVSTREGASLTHNVPQQIKKTIEEDSSPSPSVGEVVASMNVPDDAAIVQNERISGADDLTMSKTRAGQEFVVSKNSTDTPTHVEKLAFSLSRIEPVVMVALPVHRALPPVSMTMEQVDEEQASPSPWRVGVGLSSVSTWTEHGDYSKIDLGFHLHGSYFVSDHLAINVDASYSNDIYRAEREDYKADASFWKALGQPDYVTADCNMIGLSMGLEYYLRGRFDNGLSLRAATTSNFMLTESYDYHYADTKNNFSESWSMSDNQWFNGLSVGAYHQWVLSNDMSLQIGAFYETPFSGIGHGDVMLSKIGLSTRLSF